MDPTKILQKCDCHRIVFKSSLWNWVFFIYHLRVLTRFIVEVPGRGWIGKDASFSSVSWPLSGFSCGCFWNSTGELPYKISRPKAKEGRRNSGKNLSHSTPLLFVGNKLPCHSVLLRGVESGWWESGSQKSLFVKFVSAAPCLGPCERSRYRTGCPSFGAQKHTQRKVLRGQAGKIIAREFWKR